VARRFVEKISRDFASGTLRAKLSADGKRFITGIARFMVGASLLPEFKFLRIMRIRYTLPFIPRD